MIHSISHLKMCQLGMLKFCHLTCSAPNSLKQTLPCLKSANFIVHVIRVLQYFDKYKANNATILFAKPQYCYKRLINPLAVAACGHVCCTFTMTWYTFRNSAFFTTFSSAVHMGYKAVQSMFEEYSRQHFGIMFDHPTLSRISSGCNLQ